MQQFIHFSESRLHDDGSGGLGGDVTVLSESDADGGGKHGWSVVDAVAQKQSGAGGGSVSDDLQLLLRGEAGANVLYADDVGEMPHFNVPVSGEDDQFVDLMPGPQMPDEGFALLARAVVETDEAGHCAIDDDHALHAWGGWRELIREVLCQFGPSGDENGSASDTAA